MSIFSTTFLSLSGTPLKMGKIIALFNQSGGVGKTSLTMNLGFHLAQRKKNKVLLIDLDPQSSLTVFMGLDPDELTSTIKDSILDGKPINPYPEVINGMRLVPTDINLAEAEMQLFTALTREQKLKNALTPIQHSFDYILLDCPPSLGLLSILALTAATHLLVPIQCQYKSFKSTELLLRTITQTKEAVNPQLEVLGFVPTMVDSRTAQESRMLMALKDNLSDIAPIFPAIPRAIAFADASEENLPLELYDKRHSAIKVLKQIAKKVENDTKEK